MSRVTSKKHNNIIQAEMPKTHTGAHVVHTITNTSILRHEEGDYFSTDSVVSASLSSFGGADGGGFAAVCAATSAAKS